MKKFRNISDDQIRQTLETGELPESVRRAAEKVVVILTQDWCPQWHEMEAYLPDFADQATVFALEYNLHPEFSSIMEFKEETFENLEVPYLRYYVRGELITTSNFLPRNTFAALLKREKPFLVG